MIFDARSEIERSMINATAMMDAARRNQIGQPAACRIANNRFPYSFSVCAATVRQTAAPDQVNALQQMRASRRLATPGCSAICDIHKKLWTSLWIISV